MKENGIRILCIMILLIFITSGCGKVKDEIKNTDKNANVEKTVNVTNIYDKKRSEYYKDVNFDKGYEIDKSGTSYDKRITYNAVDDGSVIDGYSGHIELYLLGKGGIKEEDCLKFAEVEFMQYMDSGSWNIVQMSCTIKTSGKKKRTLVLRFANEERTRVVQYTKDGKYKEVDNSYIEKAGKADDKRYFYTNKRNSDFLFKDVESGEVLSVNTDVSELVFGKNIDAGYACDIIMAKTDEHREKSADRSDSPCGGIIFQIQTDGKKSAAVAAIYDEKGYKIFKFNDGTGDLNDLEKIDGIYVDRESLEKELAKIL